MNATDLVQYLPRSSSRSTGVDEATGKKDWDHRLGPGIPHPTRDCGGSIERFVAAVVEANPINGLRVLKAMRAGLPLEYNGGVWSDRVAAGAKVSRAKALEYAAKSLAPDAPEALLDIREEMLAGRIDHAVDMARARISAGTPGDPEANVTKKVADEADGISNAIWDDFIAKYCELHGIS